MDKELSPLQVKQLIVKSRQKAKAGLYTLHIDERHRVKDQSGLQMEYYFMAKLSKKMQVVPSLQKNEEDKPKEKPFNPFLSPQPQLFITELSTTHRLLFNKFNVYQDHLLVITKEYEPQLERLNQADLKYAGLVCQATGGVMFFNGGQKSGASQGHKHLQLLPPAAKELPILKKISSWVNDQMEKNVTNQEITKFPLFIFRHGIVILDQKSPQSLGQQWHDAYTKLHNSLIGNKNDSVQTRLDYNLFGSDNFLAMVLRKDQFALDTISVNTLGYMGSVLFRDKETWERFIQEVTPSMVLKSISMQQ